MKQNKRRLTALEEDLKWYGDMNIPVWARHTQTYSQRPTELKDLGFIIAFGLVLTVLVLGVMAAVVLFESHSL